MTNREWLMEQMQNLSDGILADKINLTYEIGCMNKNCDTKDCSQCKEEWLKAERKPKLSDAERVILENIDKEYKWIARDTSRLTIFKIKPQKTSVWVSAMMEYEYLTPFKHLFQFIKWSDTEPYEIAELLKGE